MKGVSDSPVINAVGMANSASEKVFELKEKWREIILLVNEKPIKCEKNWRENAGRGVQGFLGDGGKL